MKIRQKDSLLSTKIKICERVPHPAGRGKQGLVATIRRDPMRIARPLSSFFASLGIAFTTDDVAQLLNASYCSGAFLPPVVEADLNEESTLREIGYLATCGATTSAGGDPSSLDPNDPSFVEIGKAFIKDRGCYKLGFETALAAHGKDSQNPHPMDMAKEELMQLGRRTAKARSDLKYYINLGRKVAAADPNIDVAKMEEEDLRKLGQSYHRNRYLINLGRKLAAADPNLNVDEMEDEDFRKLGQSATKKQSLTTRGRKVAATRGMDAGAMDANDLIKVGRREENVQSSISRGKKLAAADSNLNVDEMVAEDFKKLGNKADNRQRLINKGRKLAADRNLNVDKMKEEALIKLAKKENNRLALVALGRKVAATDPNMNVDEMDDEELIKVGRKEHKRLGYVSSGRKVAVATPGMNVDKMKEEDFEKLGREKENTRRRNKRGNP